MEVSDDYQAIFIQNKPDNYLQAEIAVIFADGKVAMMGFFAFEKKHALSISIEDLPKYLERAKNLGFM
jgi:hypothetical protein